MKKDWPRVVKREEYEDDNNSWREERRLAQISEKNMRMIITAEERKEDWLRVVRREKNEDDNNLLRKSQIIAPEDMHHETYSYPARLEALTFR
ncbi:hypothetical protein Pcinc_034770 [Petrolisthes cinctipes]|uniref:Uncharacterized protein n=1 Tax=Petrolisthes cinctipes TaxID=88211 RepID=A0AAE1ENK6_PETCI|nr:hypothetical protein Pcinc_034770 [Petrolisthes cinctipes]